MKQRLLSLITMLIMGLSLTLQAQTYERLWKDVKVMEEKDLPKSALQLTKTIYAKALKGRNTSEMMKAYLLGMEYQAKIVPDSVFVDIQGLERWLSETKEPLDAAVLHSILAEIYSNYLRSYRFAANFPTSITDIPEDIKEWSPNIFIQRIFDYSRLSLKDRDLLAKTSVDAFKPIVTKGATSEYYHHDLFHLLGMRAVSSLSTCSWQAEQRYAQTKKSELISYWDTDTFLKMHIPQVSEYDYKAEILRIYQSMLQYYQLAGDMPATLLTDLNRVEYIQSNLLVNKYNGDKVLSNDPYFRQLKAMSEQYASSDVCAEVYIAMAEFGNSEANKVEALRLVREGIGKYPRYDRTNVLRNMEKEILNPRLNGRLLDVAYPNGKIDINVTYCNLKEFTVKFYKVNLPPDSENLNEYRQSRFRSSYTKLVSKQRLTMDATPDYQNNDTTLHVTVPQEGIYLVEIASDTKDVKPEYSLLYITKLNILSLPLFDNQWRIVVVDGESGHPVAHAKLCLYNSDPRGLRLMKTLCTDEKGMITIPRTKNSSLLVCAQKGTDVSMKPERLYGYYYSPEKPEQKEVLRLFTDRSIYRPGQTVYVSGIAYEQLQDSVNVLSGKDYTVQLYDVNYKMIAEKKVRTNEFGSFAGEFILPSLTLTGRFQLKVGDASAGIQVEEYKRPSFEVTFLPQTGTYSMGDSIWVKGTAKTFSGVPLQNDVVKYTVTRRAQLFVRSSSIKPLASGEVKTDDKGEFRIKVYLEPDENVQWLSSWYSSYTVEATITNQAGETQSGTMNLPIGSSSLILSTDLSGELLRDNNGKVVFYAKNLNQLPIQVTGEYAVYKTKNGSKLAGSANLSYPNNQNDNLLGECVLKSFFVSNEAFEPTAIRNLPSGEYRLVLSAKDEQGKTAEYGTDLIIYSLNDKKPPVETMSWFRVIEDKFGNGKDASLVFGTSGKDVYVFYDVLCGEKILESKTLLLTDTVVRITYPHKEEYGDGIAVQFAFVKDSRLYTQTATITKVLPDKELTMKWETFRDKLLPGQKEEWKLHIQYPDGKPAKAELLATMYDASLDKLLEHDWNMSLYFPRWTPNPYWRMDDRESDYFSLNFPFKPAKVNELDYDQLLSLGLFNFTRDFLSGRAVDVKAMSSMHIRGKAGMNAAIEGLTMDRSDIILEKEMVTEVGAVEEPQNTQIRENFAETAFFYPQLRTDSLGMVSFAFTLPESLTEWKFMGLSHTKNMDWGKLTASAVARKDFMLSPNMPRFVRIGDDSSIAASIINLTSKDLSGTVSMELFNPETNKVFFTQKQPFTVKAGKTEAVTFSFRINESVDVMACRMVADGGAFSDGEQQYIPILTDKEWITESVPMAVTGAETKTFSLSGLFNQNSKTATDKRLTVEFTGNPAWYAVQALPSLSNPMDDNAISWVSAFYANNVSSFIANANPRIKAVFDAWKVQGGTKETLWGNLQKNQDLKNILLSESPWLTEATNEAEQKQRIAILFDLNTIRNSNAVALNKLQSLQLDNGAWTWYQGMNGSRYITQFVVEAMGRQQILTDKPLEEAALDMYTKAFDYLNAEVLKEYKEMQKAEKKGAKELLPSELTVHYLYICALTNANLPEANKQANAYFIDKLSKSVGKQTIYGKAISAIILAKAGKTAAANGFMASLQEYAVETKDMGMYYDTNSAAYSYFSYKVPTQVAVIEAMELVSKNMKAVEQLKIWLLKQKQTQAWDSPLATANAVYALLNRGTDLLDSKGDVRITLGNKVIETFAPAKTAVPGLGYVKETFTGKEITPDMQTITVAKRDAGIAWGAVYAQYLEDMDKVTKNGGPLSVDKKLYVERMTDGRAQLVSLSEIKELKVGDKVVARLTITTDRDMDFVQLKDGRGACLEPLATLSGYRWQNGIGYYVAVKDASTEFFFDGLRKGTYVLEHTFYVTRKGEYASGIATLQSAYAPEFSAHSASVRIKVN